MMHRRRRVAGVAGGGRWNFYSGLSGYSVFVELQAWHLLQYDKLFCGGLSLAPACIIHSQPRANDSKAVTAPDIAQNRPYQKIQPLVSPGRSISAARRRSVKSARIRKITRTGKQAWAATSVRTSGVSIDESIAGPPLRSRFVIGEVFHQSTENLDTGTLIIPTSANRAAGRPARKRQRGQTCWPRR